MKSLYEDKIKLFTALAGSLTVFAANDAEAQTMVTRDISPDVVIDGSNANYSLDIDNDGNADFTIVRRNSGYGGSFFYFTGTGYIGDNQPAAGMSNAHTFINQNSYDWYVDNLELGDTTSYTTEYNDNPYTRLFEISSGGVLTNDYRWVGGETDKYVGVQFSIGSDVHFGWVKLDVSADLQTVTVKEVGYEGAPSALGKAGATTSADMASSAVITDITNNADASDIQLTFDKAANESNITKYRIYVVPAGPVPADALYQLQTTPAASYQNVPKTGSNLTVTLNSSLLDISGDPIVEGTDYMVVVESVGDNGTGDSYTISNNLTLGLATGTVTVNAISANVYTEGTTVHISNLQKAGVVSIVNTVGSEVYKGNVNSGETSIELANENSGVYFVHITNEDGSTSQKVLLNK